MGFFFIKFRLKFVCNFTDRLLSVLDKTLMIQILTFDIHDWYLSTIPTVHIQ